MAFSQNGRRLCIVTGDGHLLLANARSEEEAVGLFLGHFKHCKDAHVKWADDGWNGHTQLVGLKGDFRDELLDKERQVFIRTRDALACLVNYLQVPETCESAGVPIPDTTERVCILEGNPGENSDDCTTHNHELISEAKLVLKDGVPEPAWILGTLDEATKVIDNKWQDKNE